MTEKCERFTNCCMEFTTGDRIKKPQAEIKSIPSPSPKLSREAFLRAYMNDRDMKVIPWNEIWGLLQTANMRGHTPMIDSFYDALFKEARFDDHGAWTERRKNNF